MITVNRPASKGATRRETMKQNDGRSLPARNVMQLALRQSDRPILETWGEVRRIAGGCMRHRLLAGEECQSRAEHSDGGHHPEHFPHRHRPSDPCLFSA